MGPAPPSSQENKTAREYLCQQPTNGGERLKRNDEHLIPDGLA